jgi:IS30 family transposase
VSFWWSDWERRAGEGIEVFGILFRSERRSTEQETPMPYHHLTPLERGQIQAFHEEGLSLRGIARKLGRSAGTLSREFARNRAGARGYDAARAQRRYEQARATCRRGTALSHVPLRRYLLDKMTQGWSPEQVSGRLWLDFPGQPRMRVSPETIYRTLYADQGLGRALIPCLRQRRPRRRRRGERRPTRPFIPNRIGIELRPPEVDALTRYGDWEGDLVIGQGQRGAVVTLVERKSLLLRAVRVLTRHAAGVADAIIHALKDLPAHWLRTLTLDNGSEFAHHETVTRGLGTPVFFAHPYAAYERARNENTNGLLRQYLPKTVNFIELSRHQLRRYVEELNNRPRKILGYRTPLEVFHLNAVALAP